METQADMRYLVCDDEQKGRQQIEACLTALEREEVCEIIAASKVSEAQSLVRSQDFDLIIVDIAFPKDSGFDLMQDLGEDKFIVVTNWPNSHNRRICHLLGARAVIPKSAIDRELPSTVNDLFGDKKFIPELSRNGEEILVRARDIPQSEGIRILKELIHHWKVPVTALKEREGTTLTFEADLNPDTETLAELNRIVDCFEASCRWLDGEIPSGQLKRGNIQKEYTTPLVERFGDVLGTVLARLVQAAVIEKRRLHGNKETDYFEGKAKFSKATFRIKPAERLVVLMALKRGQLNIPIAEHIDSEEFAQFGLALDGVLVRVAKDRFKFILSLKLG